MRVLVLERSRASAEGLAAGLAAERDIEVEDTAASIADALKSLTRPGARVDVVVTTVNLGEEAIFELAHKLRSRGPSAPHLVVAGLPTAEAVIAQYLQAGVDAYLTEEISIRGLALTLRLLARGEILIGPKVAGHIVQRLQRQAGLLDRSGIDLSRLSTLTAREWEVLEQIGGGRSNREIARKLFIEVGTVKSHVHAILKKLNVADREEARRLLMLYRTERSDAGETASLPTV